MKPKLIRDKIPEIIKKNGNNPITIQVTGVELFEALKQKLVEEALEVQEATNYDELKAELADVLEIVTTLIETEKLDWDEIIEIREDKARTRGRFKKGYILKQVE